MAQNIRLHGGPWHGQLTSVEDNRDHFHIIEPVLTQGADPGQPPSPSVSTREGMYSRVGNTSDFEWDGWRSHD